MSWIESVFQTLSIFFSPRPRLWSLRVKTLDLGDVVRMDVGGRRGDELGMGVRMDGGATTRVGWPGHGVLLSVSTWLG